MLSAAIPRVRPQPNSTSSILCDQEIRNWNLSYMPRIRRWLGWILAMIVVLALLGAVAAGGLYYAISSKLPDVQSLKQVELQEPMYVYSSDGRLMAVYGETRRYPIQMKNVPLRLKQAFLATEDARFYEHGGVDYKGIARAVWLLASSQTARAMP
ncbi:transglycosylase domain-containing protein, partial [Xanthomonas fragariae]|uniref:transglycosylase domain-containing protein n=1 Tax=Xanthomonas fragariae TaxID=48664 RepID=UPI00190184D1